jgi:hypothetical protein
VKGRASCLTECQSGRPVPQFFQRTVIPRWDQGDGALLFAWQDQLIVCDRKEDQLAIENRHTVGELQMAHSQQRIMQ